MTSGLVPSDWSVHPVRHRQFSFGEYFLLGSKISALNVDLYHGTHYTLPAKVPRKTIVTIYDLIPLLFPAIFNAAKRLYARRMLKHALDVSERVLVPSMSTKRSILDRFSVEEEKLIVIPLGLSDRFLQIDKAASAQHAREKYRLDKPYILFVSNPKPHKGVDLLLEAFTGLAERFNDMELVFTGGDAESTKRLDVLISEHDLSARAKVLGRIPGNDIPGVFAAADLLAFPSHYEGFGFPLLESMAAGTPVVSSDAGSLPEVGGDAVCYFESGSAEHLRNGIEKVLQDTAYKEGLIEKGSSWVKNFSWMDAATKTLDCYADVLGIQKGNYVQKAT
jgi:glycosyltransferase involved in cell wall biosynthesis